MNNPYLDAALAAGVTPGGATEFSFIEHSLGRYTMRSELVKQYAWAIPDEPVVRAIATLSPIVEVYAGTGYWASLIHAAGADIVAYDSAPGKNEWTDSALYFPVKKKKAAAAVCDHHDRTLFLCWPPCGCPHAAKTLRAYRGNHIVYIGESGGGCNADEKFFELLERDWVEEQRLDIPRWDGIHDYAWFYKRKER